MRKFTEQENCWIKELVNIKGNGLSHIQDLQVSRILRNKFAFFALKWTYGDNPKVSLYDRKNDTDKKEYQYYDICDFIYFIKELEALGFIAIQKFPSEKEDPGYSILYDREKYTYDEPSDTFKPRNGKGLSSLIDSVSGQEIQMEKIGNGIYVPLQVEQAQNINLDFAYELQRYGLGIIYPLPAAVDYVNNGFKTLEERHHDAEMEVALDSAKWSKIAALIAFITLLISMCSQTKISSEQINTIETAIKNNHIKEPLRVEIGDTILTKQTENNMNTVSCHQPINLQKQ